MTGLRRRLIAIEDKRAEAEEAARARAAEGERARERLYVMLSGKAERLAEAGDTDDRAAVSPVERIARAWARGDARFGNALLMECVRLARTLPPADRRAALMSYTPDK